MLLVEKIKRELLREELSSSYAENCDVFVIANDIQKCTTLNDITNYLIDTGSADREEALEYINWVIFDEVSQN